MGHRALSIGLEHTGARANPEGMSEKGPKSASLELRSR